MRSSLVVLCTLVLVFAGQAATAAPLTLEAAIATALADNPDIHVAEARIEQATALINEAKSAFLPDLSLYAEYSRADSPSTFLFKTIDQRNFQPGTDFNHPGRIDNVESGIVARMNLYQGGSHALGREMARTGRTIATLDRTAVQNRLTAAVIDRYFAALTARDAAAIAAQAATSIKRQLRDTELRHSGGSALKSEVLSIKARLAQAESDRIRADNGCRLAAAALGRLLGDQEAATGELLSTDWQAPNPPASLHEALTTALNQRPEWQQADEAVILAADRKRRQQAALLPQVNAQAKYYHDDSALAFDHGNANWLIGAIADWTFFSGGRVNARIDAAEAALREAEATRDQARLDIELDVRSSYSNHAEALARVAVAESGVLEATEANRLVGMEYEGGSATVVRYLNAEVAFHSARMAAVAAHYDVIRAAADLCRATACFALPDAGSP